MMLKLNYDERATIPLFALPYAGGTAHAYRPFLPYLSPGVTFVPVDIPGHGSLIGLEPLRRMDEIVQHIVGFLLASGADRFALYGHSLGAHLAYLVTKQLAEEGNGVRPLHLFLSGKAGPSIPFKHHNIHKLSPAVFLEKLRSFGGLPDEFFADPEVVNFFLPILTADFQAMSTWSYSPSPAIDVPITLFYGDGDLYAEHEFAAWENETTAQVQYHKFIGTHFFIFDYPEQIGTLLSETLERYLLPTIRWSDKGVSR